MPTYEFFDNETNLFFEKIMKFSDREEFLRENPNVELVLSTPAIVSGVSGVSTARVPDGFKELLSKIGESHPNSKIGMEHGDKSIKTVRTREVVRKHIDRVTKRLGNT